MTDVEICQINREMLFDYLTIKKTNKEVNTELEKMIIRQETKMTKEDVAYVKAQINLLYQ